MPKTWEKRRTSGRRRCLKNIEIVQAQCQRLQNLLDDFLHFIRVDKIDLKAGNLNDQVQHVLDFIAPKARETQIEIYPALDADLPSVLMDAATSLRSTAEPSTQCNGSTPGFRWVVLGSYPSGRQLESLWI